MSFPEQPFGFVAGRWVRSIGDTPDDPDRAPDYVPVETGVVVFTPQVTHRVAADGSGWAGIIKDKISARLGERGQLIDAEGHDHLALAVGVYSVSYEFGSGRSWPSHYIEVKTSHTVSSPLWLPPIAPPPEGPMIENRVVTIPDGGTDGQVLVWDGAGFSWMDVPEGPQGPPGDLEFMSGTPRIVNLARGREFETNGYNHHYKSAPIGIPEGDIIYTHRVYSNDEGPNHIVIGSIVILASSIIHTYLVGAWRPPSSAKFVKSNRVQITSPVPENATLVFYGENPAAPALFSDINIINLTQVYGAGNEPSLEYMDALVKKHGGYIDGEQYVVGDALRSQTLAGQGMALRHDTTVGERVLLDHPGGTTMLWGDTGWRSIPIPTDVAGVTPAGTAPFRVRRVGDVVHAFIDRLSFTGDYVAGSLLVTVGAGFAPRNLYMPHAGYPRGNSRTVMWTSTRLTFYDGTSVVDGRWSWTFTTSDPWPTTLPGEPV